MKYKFVGDYPETFLDLGRELTPGETFDSDKVLNHPRIQLVEEKPKTTAPKVEVNE